LRRNGLIEIALGLVILAMVGTLGTTPPAAHTQVQWPFPVRLSAAALDDPASRAGALVLLAAMATDTILILFGVPVRRLRWPIRHGERVPGAGFRRRLHGRIVPADQ
jgi:hypothetical protein